MTQLSSTLIPPAVSLVGCRRLARQGSWGWSGSPKARAGLSRVRPALGAGSRLRGRHRGLCVVRRRAVHFPGRLSLRPALFPADRTSCSAPPLCSASPQWVRGETQMWLLGAGGWGGATPSKARPWEALAEPPMAASTPCHHLPSGLGPREQVGRWDSGSDQPPPLLAPLL